MRLHILGIIRCFILVIFVSCSPAKKTSLPENVPTPKTAEIVESKEDHFFIEMFKKYPGTMDSVLLHRKDWNVQIIYTQIDRSQNGIPVLTHHFFNRQNARYFYPASTVKLPVALLALEKLNELKIKGLDRNSAMITEADYSGQTAVYNDPNSRNGVPTIAQYIKKVLLVSDNDAYNRLYEFLGQEYINTAMHKKGYANTQLLHRLSIPLSEDENRHTNPVNFYDSNKILLYGKPLMFNKQSYAKRSDYLGKGYYNQTGELVNEPMDFSKKNRIELFELHQVLTSIIFPQAMSAAQRFNILEEDRRFVLQYMSQLPSESVNPSYDSSNYDASVKYIMYGAEKGKMPKNIRIFNKVGGAYGQLLDVAYVVDFEKKIEFLVSAVIYSNKDEILNDDKYDYQTIGYPFLKNLGKILYDYETKRKRDFQPDLSPFILKYDK